MHTWKPKVHMIKNNVRVTTSGCCTQGMAWQQGYHSALWGGPNTGYQVERQPHSLGK